MAANSFGTHFRITSYGESHGPAIGVVIDGCPAGLEIDENFISWQLSRRKPGQSALSSPRKEDDSFKIDSGVFEGKSTGAPIHIAIPNTDQRPDDYSELKDVFRPSHADYTYQQKYGIRDHRGGGRSSARLTAPLVAAGAIAQLLLKRQGISIQAFVSSVHNIAVDKPYEELDLSKTEVSPVRCPDPEKAEQMQQAVLKAKEEGDSLGGVISCVVRGCPAGLGEPLFDKLEARLAAAMMNINATKGFEIGSGFAGSQMKGSEHNDDFEAADNGKLRTSSNHSGGVQGGISNGMDIFFRVAFKPTATIRIKKNWVTVEGKAAPANKEGRHDPCVLPRAVPIVEAMAALCLCDLYLLNALSMLPHVK
jgi:chorismate synthase